MCENTERPKDPKDELKRRCQVCRAETRQEKKEEEIQTFLPLIIMGSVRSLAVNEYSFLSITIAYL